MPKKICKTCQKEYSYCPRCGEDLDKPTWMLMFHDENCMRIFDTLQRFYTKEYSAEQALEIIDTCDLSQKDNFQPVVLKDLEKLLATRVKKAQTKKIVNKKKEDL